MSYRYHLKNHNDIGYSNFFDTIREEYNQAWLSKSDKLSTIQQLVNDRLKPFNARVDQDEAGYLIFESEDDFNWFVLRWA
jgi:hypothetical protein